MKLANELNAHRPYKDIKLEGKVNFNKGKFQ